MNLSISPMLQAAAKVLFSIPVKARMMEAIEEANEPLEFQRINKGKGKSASHRSKKPNTPRQPKRGKGPGNKVRSIIRRSERNRRRAQVW